MQWFLLHQCMPTFFEMPGQDIYAQSWNKQLTLHEYRHVVQIQKMNQGLTKGLYYLFGDQALAAIMGVFLPFWFIEGDAVLSETINSRSGRGRSPDFSMDLKAQILDKKVYSYDKAYLGSFKDYTPDYYTLGYHLCLSGYEKFGYKIWNDALNKTARRPYMLAPFTTSIKKHFGKGKANYYKFVMNDLQKEWKKADKAFNTNDHFIEQPNPKHFTNYNFPNKINDSLIIALKTGIDDITRIVSINKKGEEKVLFTPGFSFNQSLSANDSLICWNEKAYDPRWEMRNYSVIKIHNYKTKKTSTISNKSRLFAPQLSGNGQLLCAVDVSINNQYSIVIIDIASETIIKRFITGQNFFLTLPMWSENDQKIISIAIGDQGKSILSFDLMTNETKYLTNFSFLDIKFASQNNAKLIYTAPYGETNNIYLKDLKSDKTFKITDTRFNVADLKFTKDGKHIFFSEYTADGYRISSVESKYTTKQAVSISTLPTDFAIDKIGIKSNFVLDDSIVPKKDYDIKKYSKAGHLFNLHSWGLTAIDLDNFSFSPGVNLLSQNILSSSVAIAGYYYDFNEETGKVKFSYDYYGWYPVIKLGVEYGGRKQYHFDESTEEYHQIRFTETNLSLGISLPLNFTTNKWVRGMQPYVSISQKFLKMDKDSKFSFNTDRFTSLTYQFYIYNQLKTSLRDIFPKWGQSLTFVYRHTPFGQEANTQLYTSARFYLPGIVNHHGIRLLAGYQETVSINYPYSSLLSIPRGYSNLNFSKTFSLKADYALPLLYPDLSLPAVFYLKRIYSHVFYDLLKGNKSDNWESYSSAGVEVYTDWNFLSLPVTVTLGTRVSYKIEESNMAYEFLFGLGY